MDNVGLGIPCRPHAKPYWQWQRCPGDFSDPSMKQSAVKRIKDNIGFNVLKISLSEMPLTRRDSIKAELPHEHYKRSYTLIEQ